MELVSVHGLVVSPVAVNVKLIRAATLGNPGDDTLLRGRAWYLGGATGDKAGCYWAIGESDVKLVDSTPRGQSLRDRRCLLGWPGVLV